MSCSILRNKEGVVETVLAPNGKTSKLYQDALVVIKDKEQALRLWATGYTPSFNKWMSNLKPETTQQIKPGVEELFDSNPELANQVYEALGFDTKNNLLDFNVTEDKKGLDFYTGSFKKQGEDKQYTISKNGVAKYRFRIFFTGSNNVAYVSDILKLDKNDKTINASEILPLIIEQSKKVSKEYGVDYELYIDPIISKDGIKFREVLAQKGLLEKKEFTFNKWEEDFDKNKYVYDDSFLYKIKENNQITPQQKQQALQQYSAYLDTIFPDSQVRDIVYHDGGHGKIKEEGFRKDLIGISDGGVLGNGFYFYFDRLKKYSESRSNTEQVLINTKNPKEKSEILKSANLENGLGKYEEALSKLSGIKVDTKIQGTHGKYIGNYAEALAKIGIDGVIGKFGTGKEIVVFEPEQIHILGSKQDIEGFKEFVGGESKSKQTEVKSSPVQKTVILNNGNYLNLSEEKKKEIYENYVNLMDRKREGKAIDYSKFNLMFDNLQVFNYKETYIFGEWDVQNNIFRGRLMSSPGIKELYGGLDELFKTVDFVASVPEDIGKMLEKKGLYKLEVGKNYNFRGEEMIKNLYLSDEKLVRKIFKKATNAVTEEDVKKYDTFYNQYSTQAKFIDNYIPYSIKKEQQQNIKKDVSASALSEILSILDKDKIDFKTLYYVQLLSQKFSEYIKEQPQYESREELFKKISKEVDNIFIKIRESAISNKKFNYFENKNKELITDIEGAIKDKLSIYIPKIQVDDQNFYENLKELGIYDYNAFRLARKIKSGKVTEEDKSSFIKEIVKNSSLNKIAIDKTDIFNDSKIYSELDTELNKTLASYLSNFGITTEVLENFQDKFNTDSFATVDILNKIIYTSKNNQTDYPQQAGKLIAYMMQHNPLVTEVMKDLKKYSIYRSLSKDELLDTVGDLIAEQLYKKTNTDISKSLLDKLKMLIHQFFINLTTLKLNRINRNVGFIADNVLLQNQSLITSSIYKPGAQDKKTSQVNLEEALKNDKFGNDIVDKMADHFILTGSPSLSEQGTVLRPMENHLHDLDWVSPYEKTKTEKLFNSLYPNNQFVREIKGENNDTKTWLIVPEGYKIINLEIIGDKNTVMGYDIVDENNNIVSSYDKKNDNHTGKIEAKLIDIFIYTNDKSRKEDSTGIPYILPSGKVLLLSDWRITFKAKLGYARLKDIWDYNRFVPYKSTSNLETFLDENGEPKLSTISSFLISNKKNSEPGVINNNSGVTFTTDNPLFNKCAQ